MIIFAFMYAYILYTVYHLQQNHGRGKKRLSYEDSLFLSIKFVVFSLQQMVKNLKSSSTNYKATSPAFQATSPMRGGKRGLRTAYSYGLSKRYSSRPTTLPFFM